MFIKGIDGGLTMTQEEKLKEAKRLYETANEDQKYVLERLFPELKESYDEKIRKEIKDFFSRIMLGQENFLKEDYDWNAWIAWIEKQGDKDKLIKELGEYKVKYTQEVLSQQLEKQGEQSNSDVKDYNSIDPHFVKPIDKVESKFKACDWIITNKKHIWYVDETPETTSYLYRLINQYGKVEVAEFEVVDNVARLWTIQDAKDGDVLFTSSTASHETFIFKSIDEKGYAECYFACDSEDGFREGKYHFIGRATNCKPATKEQRDQLEKAMADAGYAFDFEKKELKKVEKKPAWSKEDESWFKEIELMCLNFSNDTDYREKFSTWLKSLKNRVQPKVELTQLDKNILEAAIAFVEQNDHFNCWGGVDKHTVLSALHSLRPQNTWKPSDLPHWKKSTLPNDNTTGFNSDYFCHKGYYINYKELFEKLPKDD